MNVKDFFADWNDATKELSVSEQMRLAWAIAAEASGSHVDLRGNEKYVFPLYSARLGKADKERKA